MFIEPGRDSHDDVTQLDIQVQRRKKEKSLYKYNYSENEIRFHLVKITSLELNLTGLQ